MADKLKITLSDQQDGYGFYYGQARRGDDLVCNVNVMPPEPLCDGDMQLDSYRPDPTQWIVYADGEEIARIEKRDDVERALTPLLT